MSLDPQKRGVDDHDSCEEVATDVSQPWPFAVTQISYIYNPGPEDLLFNIDRSCDDPGAFTVLAGVTWGPMGRTCSNLHSKLKDSDGDPQEFYAFGLRGPG